MGRNEYARHRGCSRNAVRKAEATGRIAAAVIRDEGRFIGIKWRLADQLWDANTDPSQALRSVVAQQGTSAATHAVETSGRIEPKALSRSVALAAEDFVREAGFAGFVGSEPLTPAELVGLAVIFASSLADRIDAAIGVAQGGAIRSFCDRLDAEDLAAVQSVADAIALVRNHVLAAAAP